MICVKWKAAKTQDVEEDEREDAEVGGEMRRVVGG